MSWDPPQGSRRILWVTHDAGPHIGIIMVEELDEVQILCDDFTFESVDAHVAPEFVLAVIDGNARIVKRGRMLKTLVFQVFVDGKTYEAGHFH